MEVTFSGPQLRLIGMLRATLELRKGSGAQGFKGFFEGFAGLGWFRGLGVPKP